ncbi:MAG TPA: prolyl oligopeptidase family serine peptidase [Bryobacteraceae bacterium]|nr:prolyl oligopeptidase family serine peptidase [Bryobacteraceae bacterium]
MFAVLVCAAALGAQTTYQKPPKEILEVLNAPSPPVLYPNPAGTHVIIAQLRRYPEIADLAEPFVGLAGVRVNPRTNAQRLLSYNYDLKLKDVGSGTEGILALPPSPRLGTPQWSPDGRLFAVTNTTADAVEVYVGDVDCKLRRIPGLTLNGVLGSPFLWTDERTLLVRMVPKDRGKTRSAATVPSGPVVQEARGQSGPVRTLQDMLRNSNDENLFEYYATAQLATVDVQTGRITPVGKPGVYSSSSLSPDGNYVLVTALQRPYSYLHSYTAFPRMIEVWERSGKPVHTVARLPLADNVPIEGVPTGPRNVHWLATEPATLLWTEALDGGDPRRRAEHRDRLLRLRGPFSGEPVEVIRTEQRLTGDQALEASSRILLTEYDPARRWIRTALIDTAKPGTPGKQIWSRNVRERYNHPGQPVTRQLATGHVVVRLHNGAIFLNGPGGTPEGDRPFLDRMSLDTLKPERLFQCAPGEYEGVIALASEDGSRFITRHESPNDAPNYYLRSTSGQRKPITNYIDPAPQLRRIRKQLVRYKRPDGVDLSFTLYLPPDCQKGTRLPAVVYAYPLEFTDTGTAGQVAGSPQRFTTIAGASHLFYLLAGYAVLDNTSIPIVGDPQTVNDTYIEQLTASAKVAIDKGVELGVVDRARVGVIGHSYGAFMTANLLAHTDFFKAGVARSGAYNRTLTPFGFQSERRTYWEAREIYMKMSPFTYADKINEPLLLIHGQNDNNAGTFPVQSERMYQAVRGNGGTVRYVLLPYEAHGYLARESVEHTLWEMIAWFDRYVKNPGPTVSSR